MTENENMEKLIAQAVQTALTEFAKSATATQTSQEQKNAREKEPNT